MTRITLRLYYFERDSAKKYKFTVLIVLNLMEYSNQKLIDGIRQGDVAAFEMLYKQYYIFLCLIARHIVRNPSDAEEIVSDVFVKLWNIREKIEITTSVEAYLNYIEASYLKNKSIDAKADLYWKAIRSRAGIEPDYNVTINATNMTEEAKNDWAAYSAGQLLTDKTLYNIRRERRCELMAEGMRMSDLKRWRALDQLKAAPYIIEGFKIWGPMKNWYKNSDGTSKLIEAGTPGKTANVSKQSESLYLRPYRITLAATNLVRDGYSWTPAHYLEPIAIQHFIITATNTSDLTTSVIYQNPGWPLIANSGATE